jgi:hypothetical protein
VDVAPAVGLDDSRGTRASAWGDFDSDGDPDLLLGFVPGEEPVTKPFSFMRAPPVRLAGWTSMPMVTWTCFSPSGTGQTPSF